MFLRQFCIKCFNTSLVNKKSYLLISPYRQQDQFKSINGIKSLFSTSSIYAATGITATTTDKYDGLSLSDERMKNFLNKITKEYKELTINDIARSRRETHYRLQTLAPIMHIIDEQQVIQKNLKQLNDEMANEKNEELLTLIEDEKKEFNNKLENIENDLLESIFSMNTEEPCSSLIFEVSTGVGGQEAMLFAREMFDMYQEYMNYKNWNTEILNLDNTELGGIRHATAIVTGDDAFSFLQFEAGVHRVQRIPSTEKAGRVHTSTISVAVIPRPDDLDLDLKAKDLKIETKRASGAGGQHVNTTDSAVRIVHLPTGVAVECQTERSQLKNREIAMKKLQAKLCQQHLDSQMATQSATRKSQVGLSQRNEKIRTYNFNQDRITDHRLASGGTVHNLLGFLNGGAQLDELIERLRKSHRKKQIIQMIEETNNM